MASTEKTARARACAAAPRRAAASSDPTNPAIAAAYKFPKGRTLVDVGGGHGSLLAAILKANPSLKGVLFDQSAVIARAENDKHITAKGIAQRCRLESGNFFEGVPKGGDTYIMKYILHDWNDEECVKILANCRAAMNEKGKVLVVDNVVLTGNDPSWGKLLDIQMLIIGGRERTKQEFATLEGVFPLSKREKSEILTLKEAYFSRGGKRFAG